MDKQGCFIMIKASTFQKDRFILNEHTPNITATKYMNQNPRELKEEIDHRYSSTSSGIEETCRHKNH